MPKWSSYLNRFLLVSILCTLTLTLCFYGLSSYFFDEISIAEHSASLHEGLRAAEMLLRDYRANALTKEELKAALNPRINPDQNFYMILEPDGQVLCYTDAAAPYFAGDAQAQLLEELKEGGSAIVRGGGKSEFQLIIGEKTPDGSLLAGRPMRGYSGAALSFRNRMIVSMSCVLLVVLLFSTFTTRRVSRPARMITETAGRLLSGEQVSIPEDLPGEEMQEIAKAFNHMSREIAQAISALRYEREALSLVLEGLSEGVIAVNEKGELIHENAAARELLPGASKERQQVMRALLTRDGGEMSEGKLQMGAATLFYAISRLPEETGVFRGQVALIRDITEQERLERTRHDYVANISHELRTPLASIRGLAEALRDGVVTEEKDKARYYSIIVNEANRLSRLVNDLLELSSLQSNPAAFEMERVDPNELIYDLHDRNGSLFREKGLAFERELPQEPLPDIISNEDRLSQVLTILLDNARKYTPEGGSVTLGAWETPEGVRFFVRDTGIGMDEETQRLAFERFHQADKGRSDQGSGLGLSIAREVLQKLNVPIALVSAPGQGSEFSFIIPFDPQNRETGTV